MRKKTVDRTALGAKLFALRERTNPHLSIVEVADLLGMVPSTYGTRELKPKAKAFTSDFVAKVAGIFYARGVPLEDTWRDLAGFVAADVQKMADELNPMQRILQAFPGLEFDQHAFNRAVEIVDRFVSPSDLDQTIRHQLITAIYHREQSRSNR